MDDDEEVEAKEIREERRPGEVLSTFFSSSIDTINWSYSLDVVSVDDDAGSDDDEKGNVDALEAPTATVMIEVGVDEDAEERRTVENKR